MSSGKQQQGIPVRYEAQWNSIPARYQNVLRGKQKPAEAQAILPKVLPGYLSLSEPREQQKM
jgi:hypothetical protein